MAWPGGTDARSADHGAAIRRLSRRVASARHDPAALRRDARFASGHMGHLRALIFLHPRRRAFRAAPDARAALQAALRAISAAVVGVMAGFALWFGVHALFPGPVFRQPDSSSSSSGRRARALYRFRVSVVALLVICAGLAVVARAPSSPAGRKDCRRSRD